LLIASKVKGFVETGFGFSLIGGILL